MNILELVKKNRSYRKYREHERIATNQLKRFVNAARFTASSVNLQPLCYLLSNEEQGNRVIFSHTKWARLLKGYDGPAEGERPSAYIIVVQDKQIAPNTERFLVDVGIVSQTILLAAVEAGYGGIMIRTSLPEDLAHDLGLEERYVPMMILALGVPDEKIVLEEIEAGQPTAYYRDSDQLHHVPKRKLDDILL